MESISKPICKGELLMNGWTFTLFVVAVMMSIYQSIKFAKIDREIDRMDGNTEKLFDKINEMEE
jgi:hypothetical protein